MLLKVDFAALHQLAGQWRGIAVTVGINWLIKPFSMAVLGWLFIGWLFRPWLPPGQIDSYIAGLILLAAAPCTAMVFVWSNLTDGDPNFTLSQVALNDTIMVFAFAPIVGLLLGLSSITVPWQTLFLSVLLYIVVPVIAAQLWRQALLRQGGAGALAATLRRLQPVSLVRCWRPWFCCSAFRASRSCASRSSSHCSRFRSSSRSISMPALPMVSIARSACRTISPAPRP
jgi:ACR3 family arsenite transporter